MIALAVIDLPEPDLPTTQRISLAAIESVTSRMACDLSAPAGSFTLTVSRTRIAAVIGPSALD